MCSLKEPALIAELQSLLDTSYPDDDVKHTNFPALSMERRHVVVSVALQLKHWRRIPSPSFILASSV
jgi:hypothetical protein